MDLDAEMAKLQEEARRKLAARDAAEREEHQLPPEPMDPALRVPDVDLAAFGLAGEEAEDDPEGMGLVTKLGLLLVGLILFSVLWSRVLAPIVQGLIGILMLILIVVGVVTVFNAVRKRDPEA